MTSVTLQAAQVWTYPFGGHLNISFLCPPAVLSPVDMTALGEAPEPSARHNASSNIDCVQDHDPILRWFFRFKTLKSGVHIRHRECFHCHELLRTGRHVCLRWLSAFWKTLIYPSSCTLSSVSAPRCPSIVLCFHSRFIEPCVRLCRAYSALLMKLSPCPSSVSIPNVLITVDLSYYISHLLVTWAVIWNVQENAFFKACRTTNIFEYDYDGGQVSAF